MTRSFTSFYTDSKNNIEHSKLGYAIVMRDIEGIKSIISQNPLELNNTASRHNNSLSVSGLGCALLTQNHEIINILMQQQPDINAPAFFHKNGEELSAFDYAVLNNKPDLVKILLNLGADYSKYENAKSLSSEVRQEIETYNASKNLEMLMQHNGISSTAVEALLQLSNQPAK